MATPIKCGQLRIILENVTKVIEWPGKNLLVEVYLIGHGIIPESLTGEEAAATLHKDFAVKLKFSKVWGAGKFEGQKVHNEFVLSDKDVVEFHI